MRSKLVGIILMAAIIGGGCAAAPPAPSSQAVAPDVEPGDGSPVPCTPGTPPTRDEMLGLLARVSTYAPLPHLTGPALELELQWLTLQQTGWPAESGTWVSNAWFGLEISPGPSEAYTVHLAHSEYVRTVDQFVVVCSGDRWQVKQHFNGYTGKWEESARELPGQRGELTPTLIRALVEVGHKEKGPWFAQVTTGNSLARGRIVEIGRARAWKIYDAWRFAVGTPTLIHMDETHAEAHFAGGSYRLRLEKADGLWKVENATEGGEWIPAPQPLHLFPPGPIELFGLSLGHTDIARIEKLFGPPDSVKTTEWGMVYTYSHRKITVQFDSHGKMSAFAMKTGAPDSGVRVGSPVALWETVYGRQLTDERPAYDQLTYVAREGRIVEIRVTK